MRTAKVRRLVVCSLLVLAAVYCRPVWAGGVGVSDLRDTVAVSSTSDPNAVTGAPFPFHLYKARLDRSPKARRDFDFLWSDTYKSRFRMPLDSLSGPEQINDLQRLAETTGEFPGINPFALPWTDIEAAVNLLSRTESYRAATYNADRFAATGFKVAQPTYPDVERNHIDAYIYAPSFSGFSQWPTYVGDRRASDPSADFSSPGQFPSAFTSSAEDSLTGRAGNPLISNSVMIPGPLPNGVAATSATRWTRPGGTANAYLMHESTHAINADGGGETGYLHMFASGAEVVTGASTDAPRFDVDYHYTLGVTGGNLGNAYPHWQSFMAYLAFNWRGTDTTAGGWQDDLLPRWSKGSASERDLNGLASRLRNTECPECASYPGFVGLDSLARVQRLIHDWRVANYVNNPNLVGGRYGFPPQFGFSPANQLGAWQDIDVAADNNVAVPPVFTVGQSPAGREQWFAGRPAGPGASSRAFDLQMYGAEYMVIRADAGITSSTQRLLVRVRPDLALLHAMVRFPPVCALQLDEMRAGRLHASVVSYSQWNDSLFRHPELTTGVVTKSVLLDSLREDLELEVPGFGSATKAVLVVLSLGDGPLGWFSHTGESLAPTKVELGAWLVDPAVSASPVLVAGSTAGESAGSWAPDGTRLVYRQREPNGSTRLYVKNASASGVATPLRSATTRQEGPVWSPRGDKVAYLEGDSTQIWFVDVASGQPVQSGYMMGRLHDLAYSPDGGRLAYIRDLLMTDAGPKDPPRENNPMQFQVLGFRNEVRVRNVETGADSVAFLLQRDIADSLGTLYGLRWTSSSQYLTFSRFDAVGDTVNLLQLDTRTHALTMHDAQARGASIRELAPGEGPLLVETSRKVPFQVSVNPLALVFCGQQEGLTLADDLRIAIRDTLAGTSAPLGTRPGAAITQPRWSPDGTRVVYTSTRGGNSDIYVQQARPDRAPVMSNTVLPYYTFTNCAGFALNVGATDPDGDAVTYRAYGLPSGATLSGSTQVVWPAPVVGDHWFTVQALDPAGAVGTRLVHFNVYDGGDCGGGGGGEGEGEIIPGHGARQAADPNRLLNPGSALPKAVNSFLDGVAPGEWASQSARLSAAQLDGSGHYIAKVVGLRPGEFKLDRARLLVVDHDATVVPLATQDGIALGSKRVPASISVLGGIGATDGLMAAGTMVTLTWADSDSVAGVLLDCARAGAINNEVQWGIAIDVREGEGWREVDVIKPRAGYDAIASSLDGAREARLRFLSDVSVRELAGYVLSGALNASTTTVPCTAASVPGAVDSLGGVDGSALRLTRGQSVALEFDAPGAVEGMQRTLFLDYVAAFVPSTSGAGQTRATGGGSAGRFALHPASPNPFERSAQIRFELPQASRVQLEIFDAQGRRVRTLTDRMFEPGEHVLLWDGSGTSGRRLGPGVYLVRMRAGSFRAEHRVVRLGN